MDSSTEIKSKAVAPARVLSTTNQSQPASAVDTPGEGFYTSEDGASDSRDRPVPGASAIADTCSGHPNGDRAPSTARERSGSYSPYLSPQEITANAASTCVGVSEGSQSFDAQAGLSAADSGPNQAPGLGQARHNASTASTSANRVPSSNPTASHNPTVTKTSQNPTETPEFKSLAEAKKEAQKAILVTVAFKVKYQHYIDEGFDER